LASGRNNQELKDLLSGRYGKEQINFQLLSSAPQQADERHNV
jgi:hypothetical protein